MTEYRQKPLGDFVELKRGYDLPARMRTGGSVPLISSSGPSDTHGEAKVKGPGVVTGRYGTIGQVFFVKEDFWPLNTTLYVRDFKGNDPRFAYYFLGTLEWQKFNDKSGVPGINRNDAHREIVRVPDLSTQRAIAEILASLDDKIELNRRMNETLEAMAQAIFRDWFVDFGPTRRKIDGATDPVEIMGGLVANPDRARELADLFPANFGDDGLPEGWEERPLLDQASWVNGAAYKNMHFSEEPDALPVIKIAELKNGVTAGTKWTNSDLGEKYRIKDGELLFSWSGNPDTSIDTFIWTGGDAWLNQHIFAVRDNGTCSLSSLFVMLRYLKPQFAEIARNKQTTGLGHVTKEDMKRLRIAVAPPDLTGAFDSLVSPLIRLLRSKLFEARSLAATRDLLLPKLMSAEIRLRDAEAKIEAAQ